MDEVSQKIDLLSKIFDILIPSFVLKLCDRGRGLKPDWASKGMDFLIFAANPEVTKYITDEEFESFRVLAEKANNHVMGEGSDSRRQSISPNNLDRGRRFSRSNSRPGSPSRSISREETFVRKVSGKLETETDRIAMPPPQSPMSTL